MVNITDNLCTKQGNLGLNSAVYNKEQVIMTFVRCKIDILPFSLLFVKMETSEAWEIRFSWIFLTLSDELKTFI